MPKHVTVLVSNDLEFDQRVSKTCDTLIEEGFDVLLVGRQFSSSKVLQRSYSTKRFKLLFSKGALFYASFNLRLFFFLLFRKTDIILANDLDTLLPAFLVASLRRKKLVYDSHEYFTEAEGLTGREFQKNIWRSIEKFIFPKLKYVYTVNRSIASIYEEKYKVNVGVVRNIPALQKFEPANRSELRLPDDKRILLLQGAYIDPDRGGKEALEAMELLEGIVLVIVGAGREMPLLIEMAREERFKEKVIILPKMPFLELRKYTKCADIGLTLDKPLHLNYTYSLPNKLFDYIHAGVPVLGSNLPETSRIINEHGVGWVLDAVTPKSIASKVNEIFLNQEEYLVKKMNCTAASEKLNWQIESKVIRETFSALNQR